MASAATMTSSVSAYVKITPSGITANLVPYGTSMITRGHQQDLTLDPGTYSADIDGNVFNASVSERTLIVTSPPPMSDCSQDWKYEYYCRIYGVSNFPNSNGLLLPIDDPRVDPLNPSCLSNQSSEMDSLSPRPFPTTSTIIHRQRNSTVAVCQSNCLTQISSDHSRSFAGIQPHLPMDGLHGESTKCHLASDGLRSRPR